MKGIQFFLLLFFIQLSNLFSQDSTITWSKLGPPYQLPAGARLFQGQRQNPILKIWYLDIDLNQTAIAVRPYITSTKMGIVNFTQSVGAFAAINGGYFDINSSTSYSAVVYPGEVKAQNISTVYRSGIPYYVTRAFFGLTADRTPAVNWIFHFANTVDKLYTFSQPNPNAQGIPAPYPDSTNGEPYHHLLVGIGGGPVLVKDSSKHITYTEEVFWESGVGLNNPDPRTAIGFTKNGHIIFLVADGRDPNWSIGVSLIELAEILINLGCVEGMNLDGGGSSQMAVGNLLVNHPEGGTFQRPIPTILALVDADSLSIPPPIYYEKIIDTGDSECSLMGSGWFASANPGFYGTTPAMLNQIGNGSDYALFTPHLPKSSRYELFGWWVHSSNRCVNTPFIIKHAGGVDTVRVDQTQNGSQWVEIGTYTFKGAGQDTILISDAGTIGTFVVADAIRLISYDSTIVTSMVNAKKNILPEEINLFQNYPNPFNPQTIISFSLTESHAISLSVFNVIGEEVARLLYKKVLAAGMHTVVFNAENLTSGIYFCRLESENYYTQKKMLLLK